MDPVIAGGRAVSQAGELRLYEIGQFLVGVLALTAPTVLRATATTEVKGILISAIFDPTVVEFLSYIVGDVTPGAFALPKAPEALENGLSQVDGGSTILGSGLSVIPSGGGCWGPSSSR